jgi:hypothetical protein
MRRFMVHLVTEIDFIDGDEASDEAAQSYQEHLSDTLRNAAQGISPRTIKASRVESASVTEIKDELYARLRADDAREYALERHPNGHGIVRQLRPLRRRQCRSAFGDPDRPRGWQTALLQQLRRQDNVNSPRLAYRLKAERSQLSARTASKVLGSFLTCHGLTVSGESGPRSTRGQGRRQRAALDNGPLHLDYSAAAGEFTGITLMRYVS